MNLSNIEVMTTITFPVSLSADVMQSDVNVNIPFQPDFIEIKNINVQNQSDDGDDVWLFKTDLIDSARYLCSFNSNKQGTADLYSSHLQNINLVYTNRQSISGTYKFSFHGISGDNDHNAQADVAITISFVKFKHKCLIN